MIGAQMGHHFRLEHALIKGFFFKTQRKRLEPIVEFSADDRGSNRGIKATAKVGPNRNICTKTQSNGIFKQIAEFFGSFLLSACPLLIGHVKGKFPVRLLNPFSVSVFDNHVVAGAKLMDILENGSGPYGCPARKNLCKGFHIEIALNPGIQ